MENRSLYLPGFHLSTLRRKPVATASALKVLAHNDLLIQWPRPKTNRTLSYSKEEWRALPEQLTLRQIKVVVDNPGFRVQIKPPKTATPYYRITGMYTQKSVRPRSH